LAAGGLCGSITGLWQIYCRESKADFASTALSAGKSRRVQAEKAAGGRQGAIKKKLKTGYKFAANSAYIQRAEPLL